MKSQVTNEQRQLYEYVVQLPTDGTTSGSFNVDIPFPAEYMGVLNTTGATLYVTNGKLPVMPPSAKPFSPNTFLSVPIDQTQTVTVFWQSTGTIPPSEAQGIIIFSNLTIQIQGGTYSVGGVAQNVAVTNTVNVDVLSMPSGLTVGVTSQPPIQGSDYATPTPANHVAKVDSQGFQYVTFGGAAQPVKVSNSTLATSGVMGNNQFTIMTTASQISIPAGARNVSIVNMDPSNTIYLGTAGVTTANGYPVFPHQSFSFDVDPTASNLVVYAVAAQPTQAAIVGVQ